MDKAMHSEFEGPIWTNAEKEKPEYNVSVLVFIPEEDEHITTGMWDIDDKWVLLDEYRVPTAQVTYWRPMVEKPNDRKYTPTFNNDENDTTDKIIRNIQKENQALRSELQKQKEEIERQRYDLFHITADRDTLSAELAKLRQMADKQPITKSSLIEEFNTTIEAIENRCMATDGPVTPTLQEASEDELSRLWQLIQGIKKEYERLLMALVTRDGELTHKSMYAELEKQKELNAELVDVLEMFFEKDRIPAVHGAMPVALRSFRERAEDLIKKSKES